MGIVVEAPQRGARAFILDAEIMAEHCWRILLDWPRLVGDRANTKGLAKLRQILSELVPALYPANDARAIGGGELLPDGTRVEELLIALKRHFWPLVFNCSEDQWRSIKGGEDLKSWARQRHSTTARLIDHMSTSELAGFGASSIAGLPEINPEAMSRCLATDEKERFVGKPEWEGALFETSAFTRMSNHSLVSDIMAVYGGGLLARFTARLVETVDAFDRLCQMSAELSIGRPVPVSGQGPGFGLGCVEASRGRLYHRVEVEDHKVLRYQILAPTEWNFHENGPLCRGMIGAPASMAEELAGLMVSALDPCVACSIVVQE